MKKPLNKEICAFRERNKEQNLHSNEKVVAFNEKVVVTPLNALLV